MQENQTAKPSVSHAEPVLAVNDVSKTVAYYRDVLGFPDHWTYGEPTNHGGVSWNGSAFLQFSLNSEWANQPHREAVWLRARQLKSLYNLHTLKGVDIAVPLVQRPWGFAEYTIRDINGYYITFAEPFDQKRKGSFPSHVDIQNNAPHIDTLTRLCELVGWQPSTNAAMLAQIENALCAISAIDTETDETIGCAFLLGDHKTTYYIKDVIVHPDWQGRGLGTAMMQRIMEWLAKYGTPSATVGLFTGEHLAPFYKQFGFTQACGMYMQVRRDG